MFESYQQVTTKNASRTSPSSLRIGFLSTQDYLDRNAFSGTLFYMYSALNRSGFKIVHLGEPHTSSLWRNLLKYLNKILSTLRQDFTTSEMKRIRSKIQKQLDRTYCDVIFAPVSGSEVVHLNFTSPIVYLSDATPKLLAKYYQRFDNVAELQEANWEEKVAIEKSSRIVYSSEWAACSSVNAYTADPEKITVIPFGANLDRPPTKDEAMIRTKRIGKKSSCKLLFAGRDWHRKGGNVAFDTLLALHEKDVDAELWIVGCVPPNHVKHKRIKVIPHLNKKNPKHRDQFNNLFLEADFFLFPTRADCSPIVLSEASAFGLPILTTDAGGISTIIKHGKSGYMLPLSASGKDFANLIVRILSDSDHYQQLVYNSRQEYEQRLNWDSWAESIHDVFIDAIKQVR